MLITTSIEAGVAVVTLNRPEKRNAMTRAMAAELRAAIQDVAGNVIVLAAKGSAFCAGADLMELDDCDDFPKFLEDLSPLYLGHLPMPLIAAIQVPGVLLLDSSSDADHNRSVITVAGPPEAVVEGLFRAVKVAAAQIDLFTQRGAHPRIGAR